MLSMLEETVVLFKELEKIEVSHDIGGESGGYLSVGGENRDHLRCWRKNGDYFRCWRCDNGKE